MRRVMIAALAACFFGCGDGNDIETCRVAVVSSNAFAFDLNDAVPCYSTECNLAVSTEIDNECQRDAEIVREFSCGDSSATFGPVVLKPGEKATALDEFQTEKWCNLKSSAVVRTGAAMPERIQFNTETRWEPK